MPVFARPSLARLGLFLLITMAASPRLEASFFAAPLSGVVDASMTSLNSSKAQVEHVATALADEDLPHEEVPFFWFGGLPTGSNQSTSSTSAGAPISMSYCLGSHVKFEVDDEHLVRWLAEEEVGQLPSRNPTELLRPPNAGC